MDHFAGKLGWTAAYVGYLLWLGAGFLDLQCHRRTRLAQTSGLAESALHLAQLALMGLAAVFAMRFVFGRTVAIVLLAVAAAHAFMGYQDTRCAFRSRVLLPVEQHLHSVLDMAPWIAIAWLIVATWPAVLAPGWTLVPGDAIRGPLPWIAVGLPAFLLCGVPAVMEFRAAWRHARHGE